MKEDKHARVTLLHINFDFFKTFNILLSSNAYVKGPLIWSGMKKVPALLFTTRF